MRKEVKIKTSLSVSTIAAGILGGTFGFLSFGPVGAIILGGIVLTGWHDDKKRKIKEKTDNFILPIKEDELYTLAKNENPERKKKIVINTFVKEKYGSWYERKAIYKN